MKSSPFTVELRGRLLVLTLDSPGSPINVFDESAALQLRTVLREVDRDWVDAVIIDSSKPGSFINGVGLMLAAVVRHPNDVTRLTAPIRAAYRALSSVPVPTIAAIRGNCFGCGLELSLRCDYRVAVDTWETSFYMPEIPDYLFVPCFGATQYLPPMIGLSRATDLVLWGERWSAPEAQRAGVVDLIVPEQRLGAGLENLGTELIRSRTPTQTRKTPTDDETRQAVALRTRRRIDRLPPLQRDVYSRCFELLEQASRPGPADLGGHGRELLAAGRTLASPASKAAQSHFFIRQAARMRSERGYAAPGEWNVLLHDLDELREEIRRRRPRDISLDDELGTVGSGIRDTVARLELGSPESSVRGISAIVALGKVDGRNVWREDVVAYAPFWNQGVHLFEVGCRRGSEGRARALANLLSRAGFEALQTRPRDRFVLDALVDAFFDPVLRFLRDGGKLTDAEQTLREFGFVHRLEQIADRVSHASVKELSMVAPTPGRSQPELLGSVLLSLFEVASQAMEEHWVSHPSILDVFARSALDFPLARAGLCRHLTPERVQSLLPDADVRDLGRAKSYGEGAHGFYR